jgi:predicted ATPase/signal transduction histidine kinase/CheY-like chemotaxis protein
LQLIHIVIKNSETKNFLFIGSYRDNEVDSAHPAIIEIEEMKKDQIRMSEIILSPLSFVDIHTWISDTLCCSLDESTVLTDFVFSRCNGNPFFVKMLLQTLYDEHIIYHNGIKWIYNVEKLSFPAADNVVELMVHRINQFAGRTKKLLKRASCLGNNFEMWKLELACNRSLSDLSDLYPVLNSGLANIVDNQFHFAHDRVQEAAYSKLSEEKRRTIHSYIGRTLLEKQNRNPQLIYENIFDITDHLNKGDIFLIEDTALRKNRILELAQLNVQAAQRAKKAIAYLSAVNYLQLGLTCFLKLTASADSWNEYHDLGILLYTELSDVYYLSSQYEKAEQTIDLLLKRAKTVSERVKIYSILTLQQTLLGKHIDAIETGREALSLLGYPIPSSVEDKDRVILEEEKQIRTLMEHIRAHDEDNVVKNLSMMEDPVRISEFKILTLVMAPAYLSSPQVYKLVVMRGVNRSLQFGLLPDTPLCYAFYAVLLCSNETPEDIRAGFEFGQLAIELVDKMTTTTKCAVYHLIATIVLPWMKHIRNCEYYLTQGYKAGLNTGELQFAGYSRYASGLYMFLRGEPIHVVLSSVEKYIELLTKINNDTALGSVKGERYFLHHLMGKLYEGYYDLDSGAEKEYTEIKDSNALFATGHWLLYKSMLEFIYDKDVERAFKYINETAEYLQYMPALITNAIHCFYESLIISRLLSTIDVTTNKFYDVAALRLKLVTNLKRMQNWNITCPDNFENKVQLLTAELYRIDNNWDAIDFYDQAIETARRQGFTHELAIASELAAKFWYERKKPHLAKFYVEQAYKVYRVWGAARKQETMSVAYPELIGSLSLMPKYDATRSFISSTTNLSLAALDLETVISASQMISSTIDLKKLLYNIMKIIIETSGAQTGALIIDNMVEAYCEQPNFHIDALCGIPLNNWEHAACRSIIEYVSRTKETVLLRNAQDDKQFGSVDYIINNKCKSILCMPITQQNELKAVLYIENNLTSDAFTDERQQLLAVLTSQMAISLENARFFKSQIKAAEQIAEIQRNRAHEAELYRKKQDDFIDRICHEIRNPLCGIFASLDLMTNSVTNLESNIVQPITDQVKEDFIMLHECMDAIDICSRHQKTITDDVLLLSKLESETMQLHSKPFFVNETISSSLRMFDAEILKKSIRLSTQLLEQDVEVLGDCSKIVQVVINLLSNAIKYNVDNGEIRIHVEMEKMETGRIQLKYSIRDSGIGLDSDELNHLFNRFKQFHHRTQIEYSGSGLGLFITKSLVELMNGTISVESEKGMGSTFTFTVLCDPVKSETSHPSNPATNNSRSNTPESHSLNILLAEDNQINQRIFKRIVESAGHVCHVAKNGLEAIEMYERYEDLDIILMDISMPILSGLDATRQILEKEKKNGRKHVHIIGLSGNARDEHRLAALESGMELYLTKPIKKDALLNVISNLS